MRVEALPEFHTFTQAVTSTPTLIKPRHGGGPLRFVRIKAAGTMFIGPAPNGNGYPLDAGESVKLEVHGPIYVWAESNTTCSVMIV